MWLLELILFVTTLAIVWILFGYFIYIRVVGLITPKNETCKLPDSLPALSVIVPTFNEEGNILRKLANVRGLDYPMNRLEVFFVDGGSTDNTVSLLEREIGTDRSCTVVQAPDAGKINQINHVLPFCSGEIVVSTDVDAIMDADSLKWLAAEFSSREDVWVVGAYVRPVDVPALDAYHWDEHNKGRYLETDFWNSSIVLAPCYAFRRTLMQSFPDDVVADDVYIALLASAKGYRVVLSRRAKAIETRGPQDLSQMWAHKSRKSNAYLREFLRFVYLLPQMNGRTRFIIMGRINQQLILPWALILWALLLGSMITIFRIDLVVLAVVFFFVWGGITSRIMSGMVLPDGPRHYSLQTRLTGYIFTTVVLLLTGLSYPWFGQDSCYDRLYGDSRRAACRQDKHGDE